VPTTENAKTIEKMYWAHIRAMSPAERFHKALRLNAGIGAMVETQIRKKCPNMTTREMQFAIARRRYWDDPKILQMLDEAETSEKETVQ